MVKQEFAILKEKSSAYSLSFQGFFRWLWLPKKVHFPDEIQVGRKAGVARREWLRAADRMCYRKPVSKLLLCCPNTPLGLDPKRSASSGCV
jgi:hypothetical protein